MNACEPSLEQCLAFEVLSNPEEWLGTSSARCLAAFLHGAETRATQVAHPFPLWKIFGGLEDPEFYTPLVARTGQEKLTIKWATAIELCHLSQSAGLKQLRLDLIGWHQLHGFDISAVTRLKQPESEFWKDFADRPHMYMGQLDSWTLYCYLNGMERGGDWLGLPELPKASEVFSRIRTRSRKAYGSDFGAFRVYATNPGELLEWGGLLSKT